MNDNEQLRQQMWDLIYGLLESEEVAALHARIKSDPTAARMYAEVRLEADLVASAARVEDHSFSVSVPAAGEKVRAIVRSQVTPPVRTRKVSSSSAMNWLAGIAATSLLLLIMYGLFAPRAGNVQLAGNYVVTEVQAPANMPAGLTNRVKIRTRDLADNAQRTKLFVSLTDATGREYFRRDVTTDAAGAAEIEVPGAAIQLGAKLAVAPKASVRLQDNAQSPDQDSQPSSWVVSAELPVQPEPTTPYLVFDKPVYEAGETVQYTLFRVSRFSHDLRPAMPATWERESVSGESAEGAGGIAEMESRAGAPTGEAASLAAGAPPVISGKFVMPQVPSGPSEQAQSGRARALAADEPPSALALADAVKENNAPAAPAENALRLKTDAAAAAGPRARKSAATTEKMTDGSAARPPVDAFGEDIPPVDSPALQTIAAGQPIELNVPAELAEKKLLVVAMCEGVVVASEEVPPATRASNGVESGRGIARRKVSLDPPPEAAGEISIEFFDNSQQPPMLLGEQAVYREPLQKWNVAVEGLKASYAPGEQVRLTLAVTDEAARPQSASLAVRVWNEALSDEAHFIRAELAKRVLSAGDLGQDLALRSLDRTASESRWGAATLAFGNRGEAAADRKNEYSFRSNFETDADKLPLLGEAASAYFVQSKLGTTTLADNRASAVAQYQAAVAAGQRQAEAHAVTVGRVCLLAGVAVLLLVGLQALLRVRAEAKALVPAMVLALASVALGAFWLNPSSHVENLIAWQSKPLATPEPTTAPDAPNDFMAPATPSETATYSDSEGRPGAAGEGAPQPAADDQSTRDALLLDSRSAPRKQEVVDASAGAGAEPSPAGTAAPASPAPAAAPATPAAPLPSSRADITGQDKPADAPRSRATRMIRQPDEKQLAQKAAIAPAKDEADRNLGLAPRPDGFAAGRRTGGEAKDKSPVSGDVAGKALGMGGGAGRAFGGEKKAAEEAKSEALSRRETRGALPAEPAAKPADQSAPAAAAPAALYWNPQLTADEQGRAVIEFAMPEVESSYRVLIDAYGGSRIGSGTAVIVCRKEHSGTP